MRVAVIGARGQLGSDLCQELGRSGFDYLTPTRADLDVCDHARTALTLRSLRPSAIVNLAAFHRVEACEANPEIAFAVNCHAVGNLAKVANDLDALLIHISTDYVFGGDASVPYAEQSLPNPVNVYGVSKLAGEYLVRNHCRHHLVIRTSGLYGTRGSTGKGGNFVETMLRLGAEHGRVSVVNDQVLSPTNTEDLSSMVVRLMRADANGLFHVTNSGACSWYEFAKKIFVLAGTSVEVNPIPTALSGSAVSRPRFSVLENKRLQDENFGLLRSWDDALASYLVKRAATLAAVG